MLVSCVPVKWLQVGDAKGKTILGAVMMAHKPGMNAGPTESVLTWSLKRILQHIPTHTAQQTFVHVAHKTLHVVTHAAR